ncbi:MAG: hypothetical protein HQK68_03235 [Desulfamplus sp.]|nr:hypothetical protein [Desulfamplus sp.]
MKTKIVLFSPIIFWIVVVAGSLIWNLTALSQNRASNGIIFVHVSVLFMGIGGFFLVKNFRENQIEELLNKQKSHPFEFYSHDTQTEESLNRLKSNFLSNISHELRTPLNAIIGFSQLLSNSDNLDPLHRQYVETTLKNGLHLNSLINDLIDMSKIEAGYLNLSPKNFDMHKMVDQVEDICSIKADEKGLSLIFELSDNLPQYVRTDERRLQQVLINIINSAIKFTENGTITARLSVKNMVESLSSSDYPDSIDQQFRDNLFLSERTINFEIASSGYELSDYEIKRLFEPFIQTATGLSPVKSQGLGLSLSQKFVQLMGGNIDVSVKKGEGTKFSFDIDVVVVSKSYFDRQKDIKTIEKDCKICDTDLKNISVLEVQAADLFDPSALEELEPNLILSFEDALKRVHTDLIDRIIEDISFKDSQLAQSLKDMVSNYEYIRLLDILSKIQKRAKD